MLLETEPTKRQQAFITSNATNRYSYVYVSGHGVAVQFVGFINVIVPRSVGEGHTGSI
jgi:hypothetical protein